MAFEIIVHPGVDSAFIAWRAPFIDQCLGVFDVKNRMTAPRALAHDKFLVICDADKAPQAVWTGSTN
jgi:hypothetical protein